MKRVKFWKYIVCAVGASFALSSCTDNFKEYNTNQHEVTEDMLVGLLKIGSFFPTMQVDVIPTSDVDANEYQRAQNLVGDIHSGYMAAIGEWNQGNNASTYNLKFDRWNDEAFKVAYQAVMPSWKQIKDNGEKDFPEIYAVAQIIKVEAMHRITDIYGPLPYLKFGHGGITTPYDSQEVIYDSFFEDLNAAIEFLTDYIVKFPKAKPLSKYDMVYGGDFSKWVRFANSLKLRLAMRIVYADEAKARKYAEEAVAAGVIQNNADNAMLKSANGISVFNPIKVCWDSYNDIRMSANMESFLVGYKDDRLSKYFRESEYGGYHGARLGNLMYYGKDAYEPLSVPNIEAETPLQWMCAAEMYFLRAEGAIRGWNMGSEADKLYEDGIKTSFDQWKANLGSYLTSTAKPVRFDPKAGSGASEPLTTITVAWDKKAGFETQLERIITQKWLAMYPEGQEAWSEYRRTGYPKIFPVLRNNSNNTVNTQLQVRRLPFPQSEYDTNKEEVTNAGALLGGPDTGGTKVWWDKKARN